MQLSHLDGGLCLRLRPGLRRVKDRHWHLITDAELGALLTGQGCSPDRAEELVKARDTTQGDDEIEMELSRPFSGS
jgi:hypothetical protein